MKPKKKHLNLYVIIHTETYYNKKRVFCGRLNSKLTPLGHKQAQNFAKKLKDKKIDLAIISPLTRSRQTLKPILKYHPDMKVWIDARIIERDYGKLSRKSKIKYRNSHPNLYEIYHRSYESAPPGGESMIRVEKRVNSLLRDVIKLMKKQKINVLIVAHNNSIRPIRRYFEGLTPKEMMILENHKRIFVYPIAV